MLKVLPSNRYKFFFLVLSSELELIWNLLKLKYRQQMLPSSFFNSTTQSDLTNLTNCKTPKKIWNICRGKTLHHFPPWTTWSYANADNFFKVKSRALRDFRLLLLNICLDTLRTWRGRMQCCCDCELSKRIPAGPNFLLEEIMIEQSKSFLRS